MKTKVIVSFAVLCALLGCALAVSNDQSAAPTMIALSTETKEEYTGCYRSSYSRGSGSSANNCGSGKVKDAGLCYDECNDGYSGVGPVCWAECADGFSDGGTFCNKPKSYGRGAGYVTKDSCKKNHKTLGCEKYGLLYYPKCKDNFDNSGCCVCSPECPSHTTNFGAFCNKNSYGRGAGVVPSQCDSSKVKQGGMCYDACKSGYEGSATLCYKECPSGWTACGAMCLKDKTCVSQILTIVYQVGELLSGTYEASEANYVAAVKMSLTMYEIVVNWAKPACS